MKTLLATILLATLSLGAGACNPYNPELGDTPFLCGSDHPLCPEGYEAVEHSPTRCLCERRGGPLLDANRADSAPFTCNDDPNESGGGNDSVTMPTDTGVGGATTTFASDPLSVCPSGDVDVYALDAEAGQTITARVLFASEQGELTLELLASDATELATGTMISGGVEATTTAATTGAHLVRVRGGVGSENNYTLSVELATP